MGFLVKFEHYLIGDSLPQSVHLILVHCRLPVALLFGIQNLGFEVIELSLQIR